MVNGGEPFADGRADRAKDEERRQVDVTHHCSPQKAPVFIFALNTAEGSREDGHGEMDCSW